MLLPTSDNVAWYERIPVILLHKDMVKENEKAEDISLAGWGPVDPQLSPRSATDNSAEVAFSTRIVHWLSAYRGNEQPQLQKASD